MTPNTPTSITSGCPESDIQAIDAVLNDLQVSRSKGHFSTIRQVGTRFKEFLSQRRISIQTMIDGNMGESEIVGGVTRSGGQRGDSCKVQNADALRTILGKLCERGIVALAYDRCVIPATGMRPHRLPRGLRGFPEAILGIYPAWLVPERFQRGIEHNAAVPMKIRQEFRGFLNSIQQETADDGGVNEATLMTYWENTRDLALTLKLQSLHQLEGLAGVKIIQSLVDERHFHTKTSTLIHWRRVINKVLGKKSPFLMEDDQGDFLLRIRKPSKKQIIANGRKFRKRGKLHITTNGITRGCALKFAEIKRCLHYQNPRLKDGDKLDQKDLEDIFREAQEDALVKFCCLVKARPVEVAAVNCGDWKLYRGDPRDPDSKLFDGDGILYNNFRESIKKERTDKPFSQWLDAYLQRSYTPFRRAHFSRPHKGDCDLKPSKETGMIREGVALFVDPRTGQRATTGQLRSWMRKGLERAGLDPAEAKEATGYWFRRGAISSEKWNGELAQAIANSSGHSPEVMRQNYLYDEKALWVAQEREMYWKPLGITVVDLSNRSTTPASLSTDGIKDVAKQVAALMAARSLQGAPLCDADLENIADAVVYCNEVRLNEQEAAVLLEASKSKTKRWAAIGFFKRYHDGARVFYLQREIEAFKNAYTTVSKAAKTSGCSTSYWRRLCRINKVSGALSIGKKGYLVPWAAVHAMIQKKAKRTKTKRDSAGQNRNFIPPIFGTDPSKNSFLS